MKLNFDPQDDFAPLTLQAAQANIADLLYTARRGNLISMDSMYKPSRTLTEELCLAADYAYTQYCDPDAEEPIYGELDEIILTTTLLTMLHGCSPKLDQYAWKRLQKQLEGRNLEADLAYLDEYERISILRSIELLHRYFAKLEA